MSLVPLLAVPALLALLAFHLVHPNTRALRVSMATLLPDPPKSDAPKRRFSFNRLVASRRFWLRLAALLLIGAALYPFLITRPVPPAAPTSVRIVVDLSPSMALGPEAEETRLQQAVGVYKAALSKISELGEGSGPACVDVVTVDGSGRATVSRADAVDTATWSAGRDGMPLVSLTAALGASAPAGCLDPASHAVVTTDLPPRAVSYEEFPGHVVWHQVGQGVPNVGLVSLVLVGGGLGAGEAMLEIRAESHGAVLDGVTVTLSGPSTSRSVALRPEESGGDGWVATVPFDGAGAYRAVLDDGGSYSGDDIMIADLPDVTRVAVDWRLRRLSRPASLRPQAADDGGVLVADLRDNPDLPDGPFVLVYDGWTGARGDLIGAFMDNHPVLDSVNLDVLEDNAPTGVTLPNGGASPLLSVMRGGRIDWIAVRETPPGAIIPFNPASGGDRAQLSVLLLANALRFAAGGEGSRRGAAIHTDADGNPLRNVAFEADTARALAPEPDYRLLSEPPPSPEDGSADDAVRQQVKLAPWLIALALLAFAVERLVGPFWTRREST